jgi:putative transposase
MITVTKQRTQPTVDEAGAAPATGEDLLARVLDDDTVAALAEQARGQGVALLGEGGLLQQLTKRFLEAALNGEMDAHLGRDRHERGGTATPVTVSAPRR